MQQSSAVFAVGEVSENCRKRRYIYAYSRDLLATFVADQVRSKLVLYDMQPDSVEQGWCFWNVSSNTLVRRVPVLMHEYPLLQY